MKIVKEYLYEILIEGSSAMDRYYQKRFGIPMEHDTYVDEDKYDVVANVEGTPIIKNPKSLIGFDDDVRAIVDKRGDLYVAMYDREFNHGMMGNALLKAGIIKTIPFNEDATDYKQLRGIYDDQENFLLINRLFSKNMFVQSDTFQWEGDKTQRMVKLLKKKHPQFKIFLRYNV